MAMKLANMKYQQDKEWEESYHDQVLSILGSHMQSLVELEIAPEFKDKKQATDFVVKTRGRNIAVRLRRAKYKQRDWTIRSRRDNGTKTELAKLRGGCVSRYFYGWTNDRRRIVEWVLIDLDVVRSIGLLDMVWEEHDNKNENGEPDGTAFIAIPVKDLYAHGCIVAYEKIMVMQ